MDESLKPVSWLEPYDFRTLGYSGDSLITLAGDSDILVYDSLGNYTGYRDGNIYNTIPGVEVFEPVTEALNATWSFLKHIYVQEKRDDLTISINGTTDEEYTLMIAWGDYYAEVEWVSTSSGQSDIFRSTRTWLEIDFDNAKIGNYHLLTDNFSESGTGTVYIESMKSLPEPQLYNFDWDKVIANDSDAVKYTIDSNEDGIFDEIPLTFPAIYQDLIAPITDIELNGLETPISTGSTYYESVNIDLSSQDNEWWIGVKEIYYSLDSETPIYIPYIDTLVINGVWEYTLSFYAVDNFGNKEEFQTKNFTLVERPESYAGNISGYIYDDSNENGIRDEWEKYMAGWKVCIDENENGDCEENTEPFTLTNNGVYYEFASLQTCESI